MTVKQKDINMLDPILKEQYNIIEDAENLSEVDDIEYYFSESDDDFECGQGYYEDTITHIVYIDGKYYEVIVTANIVSSKQDRGDRLYWAEDIKSVVYTEIPEPTPKSEELFTFYIKEYQVKLAIDVLKEAGIEYLLSKTDD